MPAYSDRVVLRIKYSQTCFGAGSKIRHGIFWGLIFFRGIFFWLMLEALGILEGVLIFALIRLSPSLEILSTPTPPGPSREFLSFLILSKYAEDKGKNESESLLLAVFRTLYLLIESNSFKWRSFQNLGLSDTKLSYKSRALCNRMSVWLND